MKQFRDVILVVIALGLVIAVLLPGEDPEDGTSQAIDDVNIGESPGNNTVDSSQEVPQGDALADLDLAKPILGVVHRFFPIVEGSEWKYVVTGPGDMVPSATWSMKILAAPTEELPGKLAVGYGGMTETRSLRLVGGALQIDGLPFIAPRRFLGNRPVGVEGEFLPSSNLLVDGAFWKFILNRKLSYRARDLKQNIIDEKVTAVQTDMASVAGEEKVFVPAGVFDNAVRVLWTARIDIMTADGRSVLKELTTEPFRKDSMWFVPGIGMVKRRITYTSKLKEDISFSLVSYKRPQ